MIDVKKVEAIIKLFRQYDLPSLHIQTPEESISIGMPLPTRSETAAVHTLPQVSSETLSSSRPVQNVNVTPSIQEEGEKTDDQSFVVKSPFVGTFYGASGPGEPPFVKVGSHIKPQQTLCIIEAMKVMNHVKAEVEATVVEILVKEGDVVEFGTPLFKLIPCL